VAKTIHVSETFPSREELLKRFVYVHPALERPVFHTGGFERNTRLNLGATRVFDYVGYVSGATAMVALKDARRKALLPATPEELIAAQPGVPCVALGSTMVVDGAECVLAVVRKENGLALDLIPVKLDTYFPPETFHAVVGT
jgi:hypothetical protein